MTREVLLGAIPYPNEPGGGYDDLEVIATINDLLLLGRVMLVRTPRRKGER